MKILCIGQSAYDVTLPVISYPIENKKIKIGDHKVECGGGSANNCAYLLGKWGDEVYFSSVIGKDIYGERIKKELLEARVNIDYFKELEDVETTTSYIIANINSGTRTIITNKSSEMHFDKEDRIELKPDIILTDGNDYELALRTIKENPQAISIIDAGGLKEGTVELCHHVTYLVCSNDFAKDYTKIDFKYNDLETIKKVYEILKEEFKTNIVMTLESHGSFTKVDDKYILVPSVEQISLDSTGAGDIYHGAFTHFISLGYPIKEVMRLSNIAGALSVTKIGSKNSIPSLEEVINYDK